MSANLELLCAYSEPDEPEEDLPLIDLRPLREMRESLARFWKRLTVAAGALAA